MFYIFVSCFLLIGECLFWSFFNSVLSLGYLLYILSICCLDIFGKVLVNDFGCKIFGLLYFLE